MNEHKESKPIEEEDDELLMAEKAHGGLMKFDVDAIKHAVRESTDPDRYIKLGTEYNMCFKMLKSDSRLVKTVLYSYGFIQCSSKNPNFNVFWTNTHVSPHTLRSLKPWQRINHFPRSFLITKKDELYRNILRAQIQYGKGYDFMPESFSTPMVTAKRDHLKSLISEGKKFILKPANSSRGRGIVFLKSPEEVKKSMFMIFQIDDVLDTDKVLISRYISNPYLVDKKKSDLRIYVAVTSFFPLIAYMYTDGLARFAVADYNSDASGCSNDAQLTNYSLHKANDKFIKNTNVDAENIGHKWTLSAMLRHMRSRGVDTDLLMVRIEDIVIKTLLSVQRLVGSSCRKMSLLPTSCFELFGFDILVDDDCKPWLLEVNLSPSLACDAPLDSIVKTHLVCDTLSLACVPRITGKHSLNKPYQLNRNSPSIDELSNAVSTTSVAASSTIGPSTSSAAGSPATVDSGYDTNSAAGDCQSRNSPSRTKSAVRATKVKRAQQNVKNNYNARSKTEAYAERLDALIEKANAEEERMGKFVRIFPRPESRFIYGDICDDSGSEMWDLSLGEALFGSAPEASRRDYEQLHHQLITCGKFAKKSNLDKTTLNLLNSAFKTANLYAQPFYENKPKPYPAALPKLRFGVRKRTRSQVDFDIKRRVQVEEMRRAGRV